jgi:hypothetical protein
MLSLLPLHLGPTMCSEQQRYQHSTRMAQLFLFLTWQFPTAFAPLFANKYQADHVCFEMELFL